MTNEEIHDALLDVRARYGAVTPEVVVQDAADPQHPLHSRFTWDDNEAAALYRLIQARRLILNVKTITPGGVTEVRAFIPVVVSDRRAHLPIDEVMADPDTRNQVYRRYRATMKGYGDRLRQFSEFESVVEAIDSLPEALSDRLVNERR